MSACDDTPPLSDAGGRTARQMARVRRRRRPEQARHRPLLRDPGAMIYFVNGLQWSGYRRFAWSVVGESACADSWGRALRTGEPSLSIPCFAERRSGGVLDDEMLMALAPCDIDTALQTRDATLVLLDGYGHDFPSQLHGRLADYIAGHVLAAGGAAMHPVPR